MIIKEVSRAAGGTGSEYGVLRIHKRYIGQIVMIKIPTKKEIQKYGITELGKVDTESINRREEREKELEKHLDELSNLRGKKGVNPKQKTKPPRRK